jgi:hemerythrin
MDAKTLWFQPYTLGIDEIDDQHRTLFHYIEELEQGVAQRDRWVVVHHTLVALADWAKVHFAVEESVMRIFAYPGIDEHVRSHRRFDDKLRTLQEQSLTADIASETAAFLRDWLAQHIMVEDRAYAEAFIAKGLTLA